MLGGRLVAVTLLVATAACGQAPAHEGATPAPPVTTAVALTSTSTGHTVPLAVPPGWTAVAGRGWQIGLPGAPERNTSPSSRPAAYNNVTSYRSGGDHGYVVVVYDFNWTPGLDTRDTLVRALAKRGYSTEMVADPGPFPGMDAWTATSPDGRFRFISFIHPGNDAIAIAGPDDATLEQIRRTYTG